MKSYVHQVSAEDLPLLHDVRSLATGAAQDGISKRLVGHAFYSEGRIGFTVQHNDDFFDCGTLAEAIEKYNSL